MKLPRNKKVSITFVLSIVMILALVVEAYLVYLYLYPNLNVAEETLTTKDIVRVDLKSYQETINLLNDLESYIPPGLNINRANPFN